MRPPICDPGNDNAKEKLTELGVDVAALIPEVVVAPDVLATYAGKYEFAPGLTVIIRLEGSKLMTEAPGLPILELVPLSETRFVATGIDVQLDFHSDAEGNIDRLTVITSDQELSAGRIE